jgi:hypothetical protein
MLAYIPYMDPMGYIYIYRDMGSPMKSMNEMELYSCKNHQTKLAAAASHV